MQILSDVTVEGIADFLDEVHLSKRLRLSDPYYGGSIQLFVPSGGDGYLGIGPVGSNAAYTSFYEGDIETCPTKLSDLSDRGFLRIGTVDGEPKGVPRQMGEGTPIVYDAVSDSIYAYNRGNARWNQMAGGTKSVGYRAGFLPRWDSAGNLVPSPIQDFGSGWINVLGDLIPVPSGGPFSHSLGNYTTGGMWKLYASEIHTTLTDVAFLGTDPTGKIVPSSSTPGSGGGSGNVSTSDGTQGRIPVWKTTEVLTNSPLAVDGDDVIPSLSSSTFGNLTNKWSEVFSDEVRLKYTNVPFLGTNNLGQIRQASQTPVTGSGLHDRLVKYIGPAGGSGNVIGQALIEDDGANVSFHGSALPKTGLTLALGSQANPWLALYASSVTLGLTNQSALGTDSSGRIVKGTVPSLPSDIVRSPGGIDTRLAMFSASRSIVSSPASFTGTELVVNDVPLIRNSTGGPDCTLGTASRFWKGLFVDGIRLGPTMLDKPYLKTDGSGNIVGASAPSGGGGAAFDPAYLTAGWALKAGVSLSWNTEYMLAKPPSSANVTPTNGKGVTYPGSLHFVVPDAGHYVVRMHSFVNNLGIAGGVFDRVEMHLGNTNGGSIPFATTTHWLNSGVSTHALWVPMEYIFEYKPGTVGTPMHLRPSIQIYGSGTLTPILFSFHFSIHRIA